MSDAPSLRRTDKQMREDDCWDFLREAKVARVATVSADGFPYVTPLLHLVLDRAMWFHTTSALGHFRRNVDADGRACAVCDEPQAVYPYGRFECDTGLAYRSVVAFGTIEVVDDEARRVAFFDELMSRHADPAWNRPRSFYPRIADVTVYRMAVERITGKRTVLPAAQEQWPRSDRTMTPDAVPPARDE
jgi:nitroimidazol reductase NimA-like FMN-containing flavoprotein (pyridoxamine 5'-phosphate oxidase superfamily)